MAEMDLLTRKRLDLINKALLAEKVDLRNLHTLSRIEGGFINNQVRWRVWPKLLAVNRYNIADFRSYIDPHRGKIFTVSLSEFPLPVLIKITLDDSQLRCDIERSLWNYDVTKDWDDELREARRNSLSNIITAILCRNPTLHYYQVQFYARWKYICTAKPCTCIANLVLYVSVPLIGDSFFRGFMMSLVPSCLFSKMTT
jgi:hypothetical protein